MSEETALDARVSYRHQHRTLTWIIAGTLVVLAVVAVVIYKQGRDDQLARQRADRLEALFAANHLPRVVDRKTLIRVLGPHGGPVCASPSAALTKAIQDQQLANGAATVGSRPIRVDRRVVAGEQLIITVYCPDKLVAYDRYINAKGYYPVVKN